MVSIRIVTGTYVPIRFVVDEIGAEVNWNGSLQKKIMGIALPNGIENGVHQLVIQVWLLYSAHIRLPQTVWHRVYGHWP